jgi:hypothetical protein
MSTAGDPPLLPPQEPPSADTEASTGNVDEGKPPKPIIGAVIALSRDSWSAWTGGKPKADWSGLDPSSETETASPNQLRPGLSLSRLQGIQPPPHRHGHPLQPKR